MLKATLKYYLSFAKQVNLYLWSDTAIANRKWYIKYLFALSLPLLATIIKLNFYKVIGDDTPFVLYFGTVILVTGFGGVGPGILSAILTGLFADYYFLKPIDGFSLTADQGIHYFIYMTECFFLISLSGAVTRASRNLRKREVRFRAMIENSQDAIVVASKYGTILYASPAIQKVLGYSIEEFRNLSLESHFQTDEKDRLKSEFSHLTARPGDSITVVHQFLNKDENWVWIENTITNLVDYPGMKAFVFNFRNVTERILLERQKDDFVAVATHELKTPVTSIKAYAQILLAKLSKGNNPDNVKMLEKMNGQLNKLISLIGDMLDVTKIEGGRLQFQEENYPFSTMVKEVVEDLQHTTEDHDLLLEIDENPQIFGDKERMSQVISNLISNAIKYSPSSGNILVKIECHEKSVKLTVQDYGVGISEENQEKIFDRFYRVSGPENYTFPGIGLGLYISKEIVNRQFGKLWVESTKGEGSVFCVELPYDHRRAPKLNNR
jgi:PAS domain S-box-containing protein